MFRHLDSNQDTTVPRTVGLPITLWRMIVTFCNDGNGRPDYDAYYDTGDADLALRAEPS